MTAMGNRFGIQGLGAEAVHSHRDVNFSRIPEENRPTEDTELGPRTPGDLAPRQDSDQRRHWDCLLYTSPSPRDGLLSRMPSSA